MVARQDRAPFCSRLAYQRGTCQVRTISRILPKQPQPRGEAAEHLVHGEALGDHHVPSGKIRIT